jgi:lipopolysaccharide export system permease protein
MKKIIYRKIGNDCVKFFLLSTFTISVIIWVLQAVNYLDFVIEDGHGFLVYFNYTLLNFPKIFSRIFPLAIFLSFTYILLKYESKNELVIFWNFGIKKISFVNFFIKLSFAFVLLNLLLNAVITPTSQNKARSFLRTSELDFFESILKPKKFIDIVTNLTIYFDQKTESGDLINIFLKENSNKNSSQITFAKIGRLELRDNKKFITLYNGKTINNKNGKISEFQFSKTDYNITRFGTKSTVTKKTQENSTKDLVKCLLVLKDIKETVQRQELEKYYKSRNCGFENLENINKELYSRLIKPLYITFLITISLLIILKSKDDYAFRFYKFKIYLFGFLFIIFLESSSKFIGTNFLQNLFISFLPVLLVVTIYIYFLKKLTINKK